MLDQNVWKTLTLQEKAAELSGILDTLLEIESGNNPLQHTREQGKLVNIKKELKQRVEEIIHLENGENQ